MAQNRNYLAAPTVQWERHLGGFQNDEGVRTIETMDGGLFLVGNTQANTFQSSDIYFVKLSARGEVMMENSFGGNRDDAALSVVQTFDGGYVIAGYTKSDWETPSKGEKDAWLIKINSAGDMMWDKIIATQENDAFIHVSQQNDGTLLAVGYQGNETMMLKYSENGEELARYVYHKGIGTPTAATQDEQGNLIIVGNCVDKGIFLMKTNLLGEENEAFYTIFTEVALQAVSAVIYTKQAKYVLVGTSSGKKSRQDMCMMQLNSLRKIEWTHTYGGSGDDEAKSIAQTFTNQYLLTGFTYSQKTAARRSDLWLNYTDTLGNELWKQKYYIGGKQSDEGNHVLQLHNGDFVVTGFSASAKLVNDAWVVYLKNHEPFSPHSATNITAKNFLFHDTNKNDTLNTKEYSYFSLDITNNNPQDVYSVKLKLPTSPPVIGLLYPKEIIIPHLKAGKTQKISIPLSTTEALQTRSVNFPFQLCLYEGDTIAAYQIPLKTKALPQPRLRIVAHKFFPNDAPAPRIQPIGLEITLKNTGEGIAHSVNVHFALPYKADALGKFSENVGNLLPGDSVKVQCDFILKSYYEYDSLEVRCSAFERKYYNSTSEYVGMKVTDFYEAKETPLLVYGNAKKSPPYRRGGMRNMKQNWHFLSDLGMLGIIHWLAPNQSSEKIDFAHKLNYIDIKLLVVASEPLDSSQFQLLLDGKPIQEGIHYYKKDLIIKKDADDSDDDFRYTYFNRINMHEKLNNIQLKILTKNGDIKSKMAKIEVVLDKNTLHVYSIGVPDNQKDTLKRLKYTAKDAKDFADLFKNMAGGLYEKVRIQVRTSKDDTKASALEELMNTIQELQQLDTIRRNDKIILFLSSHGFMIQDSIFRITASDFSEKSKEKTSMALQKDMIDKLKILNCTTIIFLDACYSGAQLTVPNVNDRLVAKSIPQVDSIKLAKSIVNIANTEKNIHIIASSQDSEQSFEDDAWQNGAFTKAIKEALNNEAVKGEHGNIPIDNDRSTTLRELCAFLAERVPALIKAKQPISEKLQHPKASFETMNSTLPIYLRKEQ